MGVLSPFYFLTLLVNFVDEGYNSPLFPDFLTEHVELLHNFELYTLIFPSSINLSNNSTSPLLSFVSHSLRHLCMY